MRRSPPGLRAAVADAVVEDPLASGTLDGAAAEAGGLL